MASSALAPVRARARALAGEARFSGLFPRDEAVGGTFGRTSAGGRVAALIADGLIDGVAAVSGRAVLTLRGRLLADYVTRELMGY